MIDIIIVNWNAGPQLRFCVDSIIQYNAGLVGQIIVVDNGSVDSSDANIEGLPNVMLIRANENLGFGKACNLGAQYAKSDYLLFLNPDTALHAQTITRVLAHMQNPAHKHIGICGVRLIDEQGDDTTSAARFPTLRVMIGKVLRLDKIFPNVFPSHLLTASDLRENSPVDQVIGAFFMIRKCVFELCHGFDERFFVYFEEVDLSLRAKQLGYSSYMLSEVSAFHKGNGCSEQVKSARLFYSLRSRIQYAQKHYSFVELAVLVLLTGVEFPLRLVQGILRASWEDIRNTFGAYMRLIIYFVRLA
jgi:GT2 family glycosyltransferase